MEDIARMADECMRDVDNDEDDSSLEDDEDLLVGVDSFDCVGLRMATVERVHISRRQAVKTPGEKQVAVQ